MINSVDTEIQYLWEEIEKGVVKAKKSILSERSSKTSQEQSTMLFILAGLAATTLSGVDLKLKVQNHFFFILHLFLAFIVFSQLKNINFLQESSDISTMQYITNMSPRRTEKRYRV